LTSTSPFGNKFITRVYYQVLVAEGFKKIKLLKV